MNEAFPQKPKIYSAEGTVAHEVAAKALSGVNPWTLEGQTIRQNGFDITITEEMIEAVELYTTFIESEVTDMPAMDVQTLVEVSVRLDHLDPDAFGTADCVLYSPSLGEVRVYDFKYGAGVPVEVTGNKQLLYYLSGAVRTIGVKNFKKATVGVVQPRCPHTDGKVRLWDGIEAEYLAKFDFDLGEKIKATKDPKAPLIPGDWCRNYFCNAFMMGQCPAVEAQVDLQVQEDFADNPLPLIKEKTPEELGQLAQKSGRLRDLITAWDKAIRDQIESMIDAGTHVPYWKLVPKRATRKWASEKEATDFFPIMVYDELYTQPSLKSPAQAEKALKKIKVPDEIWEQFNELVVKESSGVNLVPAEDERPAIESDGDFKDDLKPKKIGESEETDKTPETCDQCVYNDGKAGKRKNLIKCLLPPVPQRKKYHTVNRTKPCKSYMETVL